MKLRGIAILVLAVSAPCLFGTVVSAPVVNNGTINYATNRVTLNGSGFEPAKTAPTVQLNGAALKIDSFKGTTRRNRAGWFHGSHRAAGT